MGKGFTIMIFMFILSGVIFSAWQSIPVIKNSAHMILDPSFGKLLGWNLSFGMLIIGGIVALFTTIVNKYTMDHETMKKIKEEQKLLKKEIEKYKDNPEKVMELNKKQLEFLPKTMDITMRPALFTFIPMILLFRWFNDFFSGIEGKIFFMSASGRFLFPNWLWAYLISVIIFSSVFKKIFRIP